MHMRLGALCFFHPPFNKSESTGQESNSLLVQKELKPFISNRVISVMLQRKHDFRWLSEGNTCKS